MKNNGKGIPAAAYYRMSSDKQEASIPEQRKAVEKWAQENGYRIIREYVDEGISGWKDDREAFQRLIADVGGGGFQAVLCWDTNRFSRFDVLEANHYWFLLDRSGVHLATCNQGRVDWRSIGGWLTASIKQYGDAQHRHQVSADVKRGHRAVAERGHSIARFPFGYLGGKGKKLTLGNDADVALVRRIFADYIGGASLRGICFALTAEGIASPNGRNWRPSTLRATLTNKAYIGTYDRCGVVIQDNHPAIIDKPTFDKVASRLANQQKCTTPHRGGGGWLFARLLRCGKCGAAMHGTPGWNGALHYACTHARDNGSCEGNRVKQDELAEQVVDAIVEQFTNPAVVKRLRDVLHRQVKTTTKPANVGTLAKRLDTIDVKLAKAKRRLVEVDVDMLPVVQEHIRDLNRQRTEVQAAWEAAQTPQKALFADVDAKMDAAMERFARLRQTLQSANTPALRKLLTETVAKLEIWSERHGRNYQMQHGVIHVRMQDLYILP